MSHPDAQSAPLSKNNEHTFCPAMIHKASRSTTSLRRKAFSRARLMRISSSLGLCQVANGIQSVMSFMAWSFYRHLMHARVCR